MIDNNLNMRVLNIDIDIKVHPTNVILYNDTLTDYSFIIRLIHGDKYFVLDKNIALTIKLNDIEIPEINYTIIDRYRGTISLKFSKELFKEFVEIQGATSQILEIIIYNESTFGNVTKNIRIPFVVLNSENYEKENYLVQTNQILGTSISTPEISNPLWRTVKRKLNFDANNINQFETVDEVYLAFIDLLNRLGDLGILNTDNFEKISAMTEDWVEELKSIKKVIIHAINEEFNLSIDTDISIPGLITEIENKIASSPIVNKIQDYLYGIHYYNLEYNDAHKYFIESNDYDFAFGACTSVRKDNLYGRNYDWTYDDSVEFVVSTDNRNGKFRTIGIASIPTVLTTDTVELDIPEIKKAYKLLPFFTVDGINEYGVIANANVVPIEGEPSNPTTPKDTKEKEIASMMLVRFVLDNFTSATEAINYIDNHVSIYPTQSLISHKYELHFMISDSDNTYLLEIVDSELKITEMIDKPFMTNFYLTDVSFNDDGKVYTPANVADGHLPTSENHITPHGAGLERYNLIVDNYSDVETELDMQTLMDKLLYTNAYTLDTNRWYTEFVGQGTELDYTVDTPESIYITNVIPVITELFETRSRDTKLTWQTVHSSVYNFDDRSLTLYIQEGSPRYKFKLSDISKYTGTKIESYVSRLTESICKNIYFTDTEIKLEDLIGNYSDYSDSVLYDIKDTVASTLNVITDTAISENKTLYEILIDANNIMNNVKSTIIQNMETLKISDEITTWNDIIIALDAVNNCVNIIRNTMTSVSGTDYSETELTTLVQVNSEMLQELKNLKDMKMSLIQVLNNKFGFDYDDTTPLSTITQALIDILTDYDDLLSGMETILGVE